MSSLLKLRKIHIQGHDYLIRNVPNDGNCFFHCLSAAVEGSSSRAKEYREFVCKTIYQNWEEWRENAPLYRRTEMNKNDYWHTMLENKGLATACEIEAASMILSRTITVWFMKMDVHRNHIFNLIPTSFGPKDSGKAINLLLESHFQLLHDSDTQDKLLKAGKIDAYCKFTNPHCSNDKLCLCESAENIESDDICQSVYTDPDQSCESATKAEPISTYISMDHTYNKINKGIRHHPPETQCVDDAGRSNEYEAPVTKEEKTISYFELNTTERKRFAMCSKYCVSYEFPAINEDKYMFKKRSQRMMYKIKVQREKMRMSSPVSGHVFVDAKDILVGLQTKDTSSLESKPDTAGSANKQKTTREDHNYSVSSHRGYNSPIVDEVEKDFGSLDSLTFDVTDKKNKDIEECLDDINLDNNEIIGCRIDLNCNSDHLSEQEINLQSICNSLNTPYEIPTKIETSYERRIRRNRIIRHRINTKRLKISLSNPDTEQMEETELMSFCRNLNISYESPAEHENKFERRKRIRCIKNRIRVKRRNLAKPDSETELKLICRNLEISYDSPAEHENKIERIKRRKRINYRIRSQRKKLEKPDCEPTDQPMPSDNIEKQFEIVMD